MRRFILTLTVILSIPSIFAQETPKEEIPKANGKDTSRYKVGNVNIYVFFMQMINEVNSAFTKIGIV